MDFSKVLEKTELKLSSLWKDLSTVREVSDLSSKLKIFIESSWFLEKIDSSLFKSVVKDNQKSLERIEQKYRKILGLMENYSISSDYSFIKVKGKGIIELSPIRLEDLKKSKKYPFVNLGYLLNPSNYLLLMLDHNKEKVDEIL